MQRTLLIGLSAAVIALANGAAVAAGQYGPGVTDTEIKIGNTNAYSARLRLTGPSASPRPPTLR